MEKISLPGIDRFKEQIVKGPEHKNESAVECEKIGKEFNRNAYWLQYRYLPHRLRDALKAYHTALEQPRTKTLFKKEGDDWRYFMGILKKTL